jgi:hypothetical protein
LGTKLEPILIKYGRKHPLSTAEHISFSNGSFISSGLDANINTPVPFFEVYPNMQSLAVSILKG